MTEAFMKTNCYIHALCGYVPDAVLTNDDLSAMVDTNDEWITSRTGIKRRHKLNADQNASDLAVEAAQKTLARCGVKAEQLTHIIAATCTPDAISPSVACLVGGKIGAGPVMAFDVSAACSGFLYGLSVCRGLLAADPDAQILFVCTEALTRRVDWTDRSTCVLFGDGASACLINAQSDGAEAELEDVVCRSDGALHDLIVVGGGTSCAYAKGDTVDEHFFIQMQGREVYKHAVRQMTHICEEVLERNGLKIDDVALLVPHQANLRIIEAVGSRLHIATEHVFTNVAEYGNTSSASVPLALRDAHDQGRLRAGDRVLMTAFGSGLTWAGGLLRFF